MALSLGNGVDWNETFHMPAAFAAERGIGETLLKDENLYREGEIKEEGGTKGEEEKEEGGTKGEEERKEEGETKGEEEGKEEGETKGEGGRKEEEDSVEETKGEEQKAVEYTLTLMAARNNAGFSAVDQEGCYYFGESLQVELQMNPKKEIEGEETGKEETGKEETGKEETGKEFM